jgi:glycosyltransferase involved in cell wall biosynthesis
VALFGVGDSAWQGGIQYISNIIHALDAIAAERKVEVHLFKSAHQEFPDLKSIVNLPFQIHLVNEAFEPFTLLNRVRWFLQRKLNGRIIPRFENYFIENEFDFVFPARLSDCNNKLNVGSWIADFQYHHFPDGANPETTRNAERVIGDIATNAKKVVLSSEFCEKDCLNLFPITKGKTFVMPFAVHIDQRKLLFSDFDLIRRKYLLPERYLMVANLFAKTKNHKTLFEAIGILKDRGTKVDLVCSGNIVDYRNHSFANEILQMITEYGIRSQVHLLGLIPRDHQIAMFRMSVAMVQPSVNEGWSTSVEEAKALGKHLLVSDIDVHKEQSPGNKFMFDALNAYDLADKIAQLWKETEGISFPVLPEEALAFSNYLEAVKKFGHQFLDIAEA